MACHLFVDEVGNSDLRGASANPNIRYLSLTGIITKAEAHKRSIQPQLDALKAEFFDHTEENPVILHRREIMRREGPFKVLHDPVVRGQFDSQILELFDKLPYIAVTVTIDKQEHLNKYTTWLYDPYHYCLRCLVERYVLWLNRHNLVGDIIVEPRFKQVDKKLKTSFLGIYNNGTENIYPRIVQRRLTSRDIRFSPKKENLAGVQICDLLAHPSYRAMRMIKDGETPPDDFGTKVVRILEARKYSRHPVHTHIIDGWGKKWLP